MGKHHIQIPLHQNSSPVRSWKMNKRITPNCQIWIIYTGSGGYGMEFATVGISPADDRNRCVCLYWMYNIHIQCKHTTNKISVFFVTEKDWDTNQLGSGFFSACKTWTDWLPLVVINFVNHGSSYQGITFPTLSGKGPASTMDVRPLRLFVGALSTKSWAKMVPQLWPRRW